MKEVDDRSQGKVRQTGSIEFLADHHWLILWHELTYQRTDIEEGSSLSRSEYQPGRFHIVDVPERGLWTEVSY